MADESESDDADEIASWPTPAQAQQRLTHLRDKAEAARTIIQWARHGKLNVVARSATISGKAVTDVLIKGPVWEQIDVMFAHDAFWRSGTFEHEQYVGASRPRTRMAFFDVRFDPAGIAAMLPPEEVPPRVTAHLDLDNIRAIPKPEAPDERRGPAVSKVALEAWFKAYLAAYGETDYTEAHARKSAEGMFHDKSVSRDRVREFLKADGPRKRGKRKPLSE